MLIDKFIYKQFDQQMEKLNAIQKKALDKETEAICTWSARQGSSLEDSKYETRPVLRVYLHNGEPREFVTNEVRWGLQNANRKNVRAFDKKIIDSVGLLRQIGIGSAMVVLYGKIFDHAHVPETEEKYADSNAWVGIHLLLRRLYSTVRIALRYNYAEKFGPRIVEKDGKIEYDYDREIWKRELQKRGVFKKGARDG